MRAQPIILSAAIFLALFGLVCLFAPAELVERFTASTDLPFVLPVQMFGAALLGFAALDWVSRHATVGGIYSRPLVLANFMHFACGSAVLLRFLVNGPRPIAIILLVLYVVFAFAFGILLFGGRKA